MSAESETNPSPKTEDPSNSDTAGELYRARLAASEQAIEDLQGLNLTLSWVRTLLFFAAFIFLVLGYTGTSYRGLQLTIGWIAAAAFLVAVVWHEHLRIRVEKHRSDCALYEHLLARIARTWSEISSPKVMQRHSDLAFADDLDVFGEASLLKLISLAGTPLGKGTLQDWLATPPANAEVQERQAATQALIPERDFRLEVIKTVRATNQVAHDEYGLPAWAESPSWLQAHPFARLLSYLGPSVMFAGLATAAYGALSGQSGLTSVGAIVVAAGALNNIFVTIFWGGWIHDIFLQVTGEHLATFEFERVFQSFANLPKDGGLLDEIREQAIDPPSSAETGFAKLHFLVRVANMQREPLFYVVYLVLQLVFLWDFRVLKRLEAWKETYGSHVQLWFQALGRCEALICSATLADEYPDWTFPTTPSPDESVFQAADMGHPLLPDDQRVTNSLEMQRSQPLILVTGSNMAGKSTFLRAVGLNVVLARVGAPVCASKFVCSHFELATSIRIRDSLKDGVSFFMAELNRLKEVVDLAAEHEPREATPELAPIFFLLDEILQGTNSQERQIAVTQVLSRLLEHGAVGMVSTHDLDLADVPEIAAVSQVVHFREYFDSESGQEVMKFDYKMRPGATPTTNALKLLEIVGLGKSEQ